MPLAGRHQRAVQRGREVQPEGGIAVAGDRGPGAVRYRRAQFGRAGQRVSPIGELASGMAVRIVGPGQQRVLPEGVVRVLERQRRPAGRLAVAPRGVGDGQVGHQRRDGFAIGGDVVQQEQQHMVIGAEREQCRAQRQLRSEVEAGLDGIA